MKRIFLVLASFALVVAACSDATEDGSSDSSTADTAATSAPPAREFTLALEPSGEFVLSQEVKPVYMIFWAEW